MKNATWKIARHELGMILREPKFLIPFFIPPILLIVSQLVLLPGEDDPWVFTRMMLNCALLIAPMVAPLAADSFAGERERGSLELLMLLPVKPSSIFYGKLLALIPLPIVFMFVAESSYVVATGFWDFAVYAKSVLLGILMSFVFTGIALFISLRVKTARATNQIAHLFIFLLLILGNVFARAYYSYALVPLFLTVAVVCAFAAVSAMSSKTFRLK
ncbi:MAG: ABC transporter permease subunit [Fibrobacter sp.]|nr:ABC transporter permease subunit [Fibrobacter sp.]